MVMSRNSIKTRTKEGVRGGEKEQKESYKQDDEEEWKVEVDIEKEEVEVVIEEK